MTNPKAVAAHVLRHLARAQSKGRSMHLEMLASDIGVRREDVRDVVTSLHVEGHVDAKRMKLTLSGFAIAASMRECHLASARAIPAPPPSQLHVA
jgi:Mn-dependent DtxR family transcriptional regulator